MRRQFATLVLLTLGVSLLTLVTTFNGCTEKDETALPTDGAQDRWSESMAAATDLHAIDGGELDDSSETPDRSALVSVGIPIDQRIRRLLSAAESGDAWAACAGEAEIVRCRRLHSRGESWSLHRIDRVARSGLSDSQIEDASERLSAQLIRVQALREACARLPLRQEQALMSLRLQAAQAGDVESMRRFAEAEGAYEDLIANPEVYRLYRQHAWPLFIAAFEAGDPYTVRLWLELVRSNSKAPLAGLMPQDWNDPWVATELAARVDANVYRGLDPQDPHYERASARADALYQRYFANPAQAGDPNHNADGSVSALTELTDIDELTRVDILDRDEGHCDLLR